MRHPPEDRGPQREPVRPRPHLRPATLVSGPGEQRRPKAALMNLLVPSRSGSLAFPASPPAFFGPRGLPRSPGSPDCSGVRPLFVALPSTSLCSGARRYSKPHLRHLLRIPSFAPPSTSALASTPRRRRRLPSVPRSHREIPFRPRGFAPPRRLSPPPRCGLVASRCRSWGSQRFAGGPFGSTVPRCAGTLRRTLVVSRTASLRPASFLPLPHSRPALRRKRLAGPRCSRTSGIGRATSRADLGVPLLVGDAPTGFRPPPRRHGRSALPPKRTARPRTPSWSRAHRLPQERRQP